MNYLASPYSNPDPDIKEHRYREALRCLAHYTKIGFVIFSPIVHSYPIEIHHSLPGDWEFWKKFDHDFISNSDELWILLIDGWAASIGIRQEIVIALKLNKPVRFVVPRGNNYQIVDYVEGKGTVSEQAESWRERICGYVEV